MIPINLKKLWGREDGASAIIAAFAFIFIIAISGVVVDLGSAYIEGSSSQNAADAAAFSASAKLPVSIDDNAGIQQVKIMATEYAQKNGMNAVSVETVELGDAFQGKYYSIQVRLKSDVAYNFGPIVGINGTTVIKSAKVKLEPVTSSTGAVPLGIQASRLSEVLTATQGQNLVIKYGGGGGTGGFFGALDLDGVKGGGAKDFASWLNFGYDGVLKVGDILPTESGNMAGPTADAFLARYSQCTHFPSQGGCNAEHYDPDCPRVVTIIVYTLLANNTVRVEGFAPFILEGINGNGEIVASKIDIETQQGETNGELGGTGDYGIYHAQLVG